MGLRSCCSDGGASISISHASWLQLNTNLCMPVGARLREFDHAIIFEPISHHAGELQVQLLLREQRQVCSKAENAPSPHMNTHKCGEAMVLHSSWPWGHRRQARSGQGLIRHSKT